MKTITHILMAMLIFLLFGCRQSGHKKSSLKVLSDTSKANDYQKEQEYTKQRMIVQEQEKLDSLRLEKILSDALKIAVQNIDKNKFYNSYEIFPDKLGAVKVEINLAYHFTETNPHLIIRRNESANTYIDIFSKSNKQFTKVVSHQQWAMTYVNDTTRDINGDGLKDFVVNWYGSNGCCLKAFSDVYLLRTNKTSFSSSFEFINPTFSPIEKIIRGVCYGHPGQTEMYKYKWNKETIDTLEYVSYEKDDKGVKTGKFIISTDVNYGGHYRILKRLNSVPPEYKKIEGYDWFTGAGYD
ncbi:XAC2610-related protein [Foetidibacter luteolus]|uniref:XAC2610-related protein n=1 Tax=Foetidibacter luteolus TaxID=2608880 RepID=UPI00129BBE74|nr:hypothetical protein [Foetidibacter luteolus]